MAFNTAEGRAEYTASAGQTVFSFVFKIFSSSDIKVYLTPNGSFADDTADLLTITTDYTVTINGDNGGDITLISGASAGDTIVLARSLAATRTVDYQNNGDFNADTIDNDQNYQTYLIVDGYTQLGRALIADESLIGVSLSLPPPTAYSYLRWNSTADAIENDSAIYDVIDNISDINTVSTNITSIIINATNILDINTVASISANVTIVAGSITNVSTVAANVADINLVATNIAEILLADDYAAQAANSALVAAAYANMEWAGFSLSDGELIVSYTSGATSLPSLVDGEFIITY